MAVSVKGDAGFHAGPPSELFQTSLPVELAAVPFPDAGGRIARGRDWNYDRIRGNDGS